MRWTADQDDRLRQLAAAGLSTRDSAERMGVTRGAASCRARRLGLRFDPAASRPLMKFLREKGVLQREQIGGSIGVRWTPVTRTGGHFPPALCELLLADGQLSPIAGRDDIFGPREGISA
ncbi:hypothetical protein [Caulobacter sp. 1776]|uniref:hypothetical protein n=1 Tax=Caulobacter sp. 1776 TaxID=3156420 RepID=UPI0033914A9F